MERRYTPPPQGYAPRPAGYAPPDYLYSSPGYLYPPAYRYPAANAPETLPYMDGSIIPPGYHREGRVRKGLVTAGAVSFGVMYLVSVTDALMSNEGMLLVPVAGPFVQLDPRNRFGFEAAPSCKAPSVTTPPRSISSATSARASSELIPVRMTFAPTSCAPRARR